MKLTIIETGLPPEPIRSNYRDGYPGMFETLLGAVSDELTFETVALETGEVLPDPETLDAVLITGSAHGVYDPVSWLPSLREWIGFVAETQAPMIGICFGHQVIADALGGDVRKSEKGWGIGRHSYDITHRPDWLTSVPETFGVGVSHQDQVITPPVDAKVFAASDFTENAALVYSRAPILTFQGHPEFNDAYLTDLYSCRVGKYFTQDEVDAALLSLKIPADDELVAKWMLEFLLANKKAAG